RLGLLQLRLARGELLLARTQTLLGELVDRRRLRQLLRTVERRFLPVELRLARDELRLLLVDVSQAPLDFDRRLAVSDDVALQLLAARLELRLELLELELALVELLRARVHLLLAGRPRCRELRLAPLERLLLRRHLHPCLLELALACGELLFTHAKLVACRAHCLLEPIDVVAEDGLLLEPLGPRAQLVLELVQLLLARVELLRTRLDELFARRAHVHDLLLAAVEQLLLRLDRAARFRQSAFALGDCPLALGQRLLALRELLLAHVEPLFELLLLALDL